MLNHVVYCLKYQTNKQIRKILKSKIFNKKNGNFKSIIKMNYEKINGMNSSSSSSYSTTPINYAIPSLQIEPGPFVFTCVSYFLSFITPYDLSVDILRDIVHSNFTFADLTTGTLKVEAGFISLMTIFVTLSVIPLGATVSWCCKRKSSVNQRSEPVNPLMQMNENFEQTLHCRKKISIITLILVFTILIFLEIIIFITNNRLSTAVDMTANLVQLSLKDFQTFVKDSHVQIKNKLDNGFDISVHNVIKDLEDIDIILGESIKTEISSNTGIELAFDSLNRISSANFELTNRILLLEESISKSLKISQEAAARMEELQIQLSVLQRQCTFRDRPLCDTLRIRSFEENGIIDALKTLQEDQSIFKMRYLGELEIDGSVKNLSKEVATSKSIYENFPLQVKSETIIQRNETIEQLNLIKDRTTTMAQMLTQTIVNLLDRVGGTWESIEPYYEQLKMWSDKFWTLIWMASMIVLWIVLFMSLTFCCVGCGSNVKAAVLLVTSVCIICFGSFVIMLLGVFTLAVGGNSEIIICRPLYDSDHYEILTKMFDKPGFFYANEPETGIIGEFLRPPGTNHSIVNVSLASAIRNCERNMPAYKVFQLDAFVNITQMVDIRQYPKVNTAIDSIRVSERPLLRLTQTIHSILENMLQTSDLNLTAYRNSITQPTPEKDLSTFIDQMQRVALQIQDVATSSRMTTLGSRSKRLLASILQPLEQLRSEILFHLTALELQMDPWKKQVNQTSTHLNTVQQFIENTGRDVCKNYTNSYIKRLKSYLTADKGRVSLTLGDGTARCRPLFDIFDANRIHYCRNAIDGINGLWFCIFICLLLWSIGVPIALNLITLHYKIKEVIALRGSTSRSYRSSDTRPSEQSNVRSQQQETPSRTRSSRQTSNVGPVPPPPPPAPPQMNRQDSVRSVRWETSEDIVFEEVEAGNPAMMPYIIPPDYS